MKKLSKDSKTFHTFFFSKCYLADSKLFQIFLVEVRTVDSDQDNIPKLSGGNLGEYILDSIHFHWKSEHTINGRR